MILKSIDCSLAASLLPSGATAVGFGGYVGSSRIDTSTPITQDTDSPFLVFQVPFPPFYDVHQYLSFRSSKF